ncbi:BCL2/adenovirus E1B 19 kDa protein-interacting protein 3 [Lingula anatina]|uniref:BCL2/adenovirus E1B 19 kDa protein-interacting protein 3 n=1 Tax=Lingula anatina TaxID=7574 RepID=A0A1S3J6C6_LINAN|nr:BCL2/adenovirus E1B 19 kDa protein-interacting protein 3 [Lingula anatina]|eukprot:XP_013405945.1 BCL2/adenovirus E1B 19 kDa protein-interacting protein 3 [Lingula anatina]
MAAVPKSSQEEALNDSWVELHFQQNGSGTGSETNGRPTSVYTGNMEKLLIEAQKEGSRASSRVTSSSSSRGSPKGPPSPNESHQELQNADWIWDWSSRPEVMPPSDWHIRFKHPEHSRRATVHSSGPRKAGLFSMENLRLLLCTHASVFVMGAAVGAAMAILYIKKYANLTVSSS